VSNNTTKVSSPSSNLSARAADRANDSTCATPSRAPAFAVDEDVLDDKGSGASPTHTSPPKDGMGSGGRGSSGSEANGGPLAGDVIHAVLHCSVL
jgi:hypothetical protein